MVTTSNHPVATDPVMTSRCHAGCEVRRFVDRNRCSLSEKGGKPSWNDGYISQSITRRCSPSYRTTSGLYSLCHVVLGLDPFAEPPAAVRFVD